MKDEIITGEQLPVEEEAAPAPELPVNKERLQKFNQILQKYKSGKASVERRVVNAEQWWKMRNEAQEKRMGLAWDESFRCKSGWLHNVLVSKHADAMENYPEPLFLAREPGDKAEAQKLSAIVPLILEENDFEQTYSDVWWQKLKTGTGVYMVPWNSEKLNTLGDVDIRPVDILSVFWEPGITDIQQSKYFFNCELQDNEMLEAMYPELKDQLKGSTFTLTRYIYDDNVPTDGKSLVVDVYYKVNNGGQSILHYCKYVNDHVLVSTENDDPTVGLYDDGLYPFVFDPLFPVAGSPCGYGYVDLCMNTQAQIDIMDTAILKNMVVGVTPRYFIDGSTGSINEQEMLDVTKPFVHVGGSLANNSIQVMDYKPLAGNYISAYQNKVAELRETSGNTETATGSGTSGVTSASGIAALQEASGKTSRDASKAAYRAFRRLVNMVVERIRQFYDMPRQFRITGQFGQEQFTSYDNSGLQPQWQGGIGDTDLGYRLPVFDIKIEVAKKNAYTRTAQNDLALQFYNLGFFRPDMSTMAISCLDMMDFDGKDELMLKLQQTGTIFTQMQQLSQYVMALLQKYEPENAQAMAAALGMGGAEGGPAPAAAPAGAEAPKTESSEEEHPFVEKARAAANGASTPGGGKLI